eukprot:6993864-Pyramimonas_sp.AAC.1
MFNDGVRLLFATWLSLQCRAHVSEKLKIYHSYKDEGRFHFKIKLSLETSMNNMRYHHQRVVVVDDD